MKYFNIKSIVLTLIIYLGIMCLPTYAQDYYCNTITINNSQQTYKGNDVPVDFNIYVKNTKSVEQIAQDLQVGFDVEPVRYAGFWWCIDEAKFPIGTADIIASEQTIVSNGETYKNYTIKKTIRGVDIGVNKKNHVSLAYSADICSLPESTPTSTEKFDCKSFFTPYEESYEGIEAVGGNCPVDATSRFNCTRVGNQGNYLFEITDAGGFTNNNPCNITGTNTEIKQKYDSICNNSLFSSNYEPAFCLSCEKITQVTNAGYADIGETCNNTTKCNPDQAKCFEGKCIANAGTIVRGEECKVGYLGCEMSNICVGNDRTKPWESGTDGTCLDSLSDEVQNLRITCDANVVTSCDDKKATLGYTDAVCYEGTCIFSNKEVIDSLDIPDPVASRDVRPNVPAPPSRVIEKCTGNTNCANCVARLTGGAPFPDFSTAAAAEYPYNLAVDKWEKDSNEQDKYITPPKPEGFVYTGYIYTSLGCLDTTDNGLITRVVQIALGITGAVILVRFAQAAIKLQGGGSPEDRAEAVEIVSSAVVALLLFVISIIGLRYIGVNVFQIFSPGTLEFAEEEPPTP